MLEKLPPTSFLPPSILISGREVIPGDFIPVLASSETWGKEGAGSLTIVTQ